MRLPGILVRLALVAVTTFLAGCHTASGRAIESRLGGSLDKLWRSTAQVISGEVGRSGRFRRSTHYRAWQPQTRLAALVTSARSTLARSGDRIVAMPGQLLQFPMGATRDAVKRIRSFGHRDDPLVQNHEPGHLVGRLVDGIAGLARRSEFARPILGGPGDPDRSTDPDVVRRQQTWIERLLRRF
jgi:hypothetical protein